MVDSAIARIESANSKINAVVAEYFDKARKQAKTALPASPLSGMPYLIKDLNEIKGEIATSGSRLIHCLVCLGPRHSAAWSPAAL